MFQFPSFAATRLCIQRALTGHDACRVSPFGHPRVEACSSSPWLFAGSRVLHRLLTPRHPPCALCSLTLPAPREGRPVTATPVQSLGGWSSPRFCSTPHGSPPFALSVIKLGAYASFVTDRFRSSSSILRLSGSGKSCPSPGLPAGGCSCGRWRIPGSNR